MELKAKMDNLGGYAQNEAAGLNEAELEARALIKAAGALNNVKEHWQGANDELTQALERNRRLWSILASAMREDDCPQPNEVKQNILNLASFIFKRTLEILAQPAPEKLDILININMNIARGLSGNAG